MCSVSRSWNVLVCLQSNRELKLTPNSTFIIVKNTHLSLLVTFIIVTKAPDLKYTTQINVELLLVTGAEQNV